MVALFPKSKVVLNSLVPALSDQIRYDAPEENDASEALVELLRQADPERTYARLRGRSGTRHFLSIFLAS